MYNANMLTEISVLYQLVFHGFDNPLYGFLVDDLLLKLLILRKVDQD